MGPFRAEQLRERGRFGETVLVESAWGGMYAERAVGGLMAHRGAGWARASFDM